MAGGRRSRARGRRPGLHPAHRAGDGPRRAAAEAAAALFRLGLGARLGTGEQYFPIDLAARLGRRPCRYLAETRDGSGAFNLCCPETPTNAEFTEALAEALHRPAFLAAPARGPQGRRGPMAPSSSARSTSGRPPSSGPGYDFQDVDVREVLAAALA